jgi:hypothetical protein
MRVAPTICTACPIERQQHQCSSGDKKEGTNRITSPYKLFKVHLGVVGAFLGPVEGEKPD